MKKLCESLAGVLCSAITFCVLLILVACGNGGGNVQVPSLQAENDGSSSSPFVEIPYNSTAFPISGVMTNDRLTNSTDQMVLFNLLADDPSLGTARVVGDNIEFTPHIGATGNDSFMYTVTAGSLTSSATVSVRIKSPTGREVFAKDDGVYFVFHSIFQPLPTQLDVLANDGPNPSTLTILSTTSVNATISVDGKYIQYQASQEGSDTFSYTVTDGSTTASANVTVEAYTPVNGQLINSTDDHVRLTIGGFPPIDMPTGIVFSQIPRSPNAETSVSIIGVSENKQVGSAFANATIFSPVRIEFYLDSNGSPHISISPLR